MDEWDAINDGPYNEEPLQQGTLPIWFVKVHNSQYIGFYDWFESLC